jgi:NitT/TauT family transport system substrate-binding protein
MAKTTSARRGMQDRKRGLSRMLATLCAAILFGAACTPGALPPAPTSAPAAQPTAAPAAPAPQATAAAAAKPTTAPAGQPTAPAAQPTTAPAGLTRVRYGLPAAPPSITVMGVFYALDNGYFRDEGLDVEVLQLGSSTTALRALLSREADIALVGGSNPYDARANGAPIKIIASPVEKGTDEVIARQNVSSLKDLTGKRWGLNTPNEPLFFAAKALAERNGVDPASIEFLAIGSVADRVRALLTDRVDVVAVTILILQPVHDAIDKGELSVLTSMAKEFPDLPLAYDVTRDDLAAEQGPMLTKFLKAELKGIRWANQNPDKAAEIALKYIKEVDPALMARGMKRMSDLGVYGLDGGLSKERADRTQQLLIDQGVLKRPLPAEEMLDTRFVEQAVKELGPAGR